MYESIEEVIRVEGGRVVATLARMTHDLDLAEDAFGDAAELALVRWPIDGTPDRPGAWLTTVARRKALDVLRREAKRQAKQDEAMAMLADTGPVPYHTVRDDQLRLIFTCCHPALPTEAHVALALRILCRLTTAEIARAFLVAESAMGQRISRAKAKIAAAHIAYRIPADAELPQRLHGVLEVIKLVFTTGHHAPTGAQLDRVDLAEEGLRLGHLIVNLMPEEPECAGLLALMLSTHARRSTRVDESGDVVLLRDADRTAWEHGAINEACQLLEQALMVGRPGPFQVQAAISCLHSCAPTAVDTDWSQIVTLYQRLEAMQPTAVVRVNHAIALAELVGPDAALALLEPDDPLLRSASQWHFLHLARADLLERVGRVAEALDTYDAALACGPNDAERRFVLRRRQLLA